MSTTSRCKDRRSKTIQIDCITERKGDCRPMHSPNDLPPLAYSPKPTDFPHSNFKPLLGRPSAAPQVVASTFKLPIPICQMAADPPAALRTSDSAFEVRSVCSWKSCQPLQDAKTDVARRSKLIALRKEKVTVAPCIPLTTSSPRIQSETR